MTSPDVIKQLVQIDKGSNAPVYLQVSNALIQAIRKGHLHNKLKLPGTRELSSVLNIHRKTAVAAYDELVAQGWIEMVARKGTFVSTKLPEVKPVRLKKDEEVLRYPEKTLFTIENKSIPVVPVVNFQTSKLVINDGFPDVRLAPTEVLFRELRSLANKSAFKKYYQYGSPKGSDVLCETLSRFLGETRGLPITAENVMITQGAQMGIYLTSSVLLKPGDNVIVGEPSYFATTQSFQQLGAVINRVPVDDKGIDVNAVEELCRKKKIRCIYVIPHHHHPTTVALIPERRIRLLQLAKQYKFAIIEDDYDYDFHYSSNPILPLASLDHYGNVIYIGTLTKTLAPAIRVGFVVAPKNFIDALIQLRRVIDRQGDTLMEVAIAQLYNNGTVSRHIKKSVKIYEERRNHFAHLLKTKLGDKISFEVPCGGMSIWARFNTKPLPDIAQRAAQKGLYVSNGKIYNSAHNNYNSCRMGFASLNFKEQEKAISILSACI